MSKVTATAETPAAPVATTTTVTECLIHVRFAPNGVVTEIGERPASATAQQWFDHLSRNTVNRYRPLSGGRGVFQLARTVVDDLKTACAVELGA